MPFFRARHLVAEQLEHPVVSEAEVVRVGSRRGSWVELEALASRLLLGMAQ